MEPFALPVALQVVAVLGIRVRVLRPDVRQLVLIQLQHLLQRREVVRLGLAELECHEAWFCGLTFELRHERRQAM